MTFSKQNENNIESKPIKNKLKESLSVFEGTKSMKKELLKYKNEVEILKNKLNSKLISKESSNKNIKSISEESSYKKEELLKNKDLLNKDLIKNMKIRIKELKEENKDLKKYKELKEENKEEEINLEIKELKQEINLLNKQLEEKTTYNNILQQEIEDIELRYEFEFKRKEELESENIELKNNLKEEINKKEINKSLEDLENEILILKNCLKTKDEKYEILSKTLIEIKNENEIKNEREILFEDLKYSLDNLKKHINILKLSKSELNKQNREICEENKNLLEDKIYWLGMFQKFFKLFGKEEQNIKDFYENVINSNFPEFLKKKKLDKKEINKPDWSEKSLEALKNQYSEDKLKEYEDINSRLKGLFDVSNTILSYSNDSSDDSTSNEVDDNNDNAGEVVILKEQSNTSLIEEYCKSNEIETYNTASDISNNQEKQEENTIIYKNHLETISLLKEILKNLKKPINEITLTNEEKNERIEKLNETMKKFNKKLIKKFQIIIEEQGARLENFLTLKELTVPKGGFSESIYKRKYEELKIAISNIYEILSSKSKKTRKIFCKELKGHINKLKKLTNKNVIKLVSDLNLCIEFVNETDTINNIIEDVISANEV